ncbi:hypothetical protein P7C70_g4037, partial [Phenoliferia sp. Uapishka_3]
MATKRHTRSHGDPPVAVSLPLAPLPRASAVRSANHVKVAPPPRLPTPTIPHPLLLLAPFNVVNDSEPDRNSDLASQETVTSHSASDAGFDAESNVGEAYNYSSGGRQIEQTFERWTLDELVEALERRQNRDTSTLQVFAVQIPPGDKQNAGFMKDSRWVCLSCRNTLIRSASEKEKDGVPWPKMKRHFLSSSEPCGSYSQASTMLRWSKDLLTPGSLDVLKHLIPTVSAINVPIKVREGDIRRPAPRALSRLKRPLQREESADSDPEVASPIPDVEFYRRFDETGFAARRRLATNFLADHSDIFGCGDSDNLLSSPRAQFQLTPIITSFGGFKVTPKLLRTVVAPVGWLEDIGLNAALSTLNFLGGWLPGVPKWDSNFYVLPVTWTQLNAGSADVQLSSCDYIIAPLNVDGNHWLFVVATLEDHTFRVYDSLKSIRVGKRVIKKLIDFLTASCGNVDLPVPAYETWDQIPSTPDTYTQQIDGSSCGLHTFFGCAQLALHAISRRDNPTLLVLPEFTPTLNVEEARRDLLDIILHMRMPQDLRQRPDSIYHSRPTLRSLWEERAGSRSSTPSTIGNDADNDGAASSGSDWSASPAAEVTGTASRRSVSPLTVAFDNSVTLESVE